MASLNVLWLSQIAGHAILFILALCIIVPLDMNLREFGGHCLLFSTGKWREEDGMLDVQWASPGFCNFPIVTGICIFFFSSLQIYRYARMRDEPSFLALFVDVVLGIWLLSMSILSAIFITWGFVVWCEKMTERFPACETSAGQNITTSGDSNKIDNSRFYIEMGTGQFGAWGCFAISVGVAVIALLKLINNHQVRNIKVSMYLERQRLVNQHQPGPPFDSGRSTPPPPPIAAASSEESDNK